MIRCSIGTAKVLGLRKVKVDALPTTAYLMIGDKCRFNCAFCAQARESEARADMLSRVSWPEFDKDQVLEGLSAEESKDNLDLICFQVVQDSAALEETKEWIKEVKTVSSAPICVSAGPRNVQEIEEMLKLGVEHVSIALDAATPEIFARMKDGSWDARYNLLKQGAELFPGHMVTHLIVGLGETEEEMIGRIQEMQDWGVIVALFAFTPVRGTQMESVPQPEMRNYRHIQAALHLVRHGYARAEQFSFRDGKLLSFGLDRESLENIFTDGEAFRTSGCTGCNRPYYNETPGEELYNYPRTLTTGEVRRAWEVLLDGLEMAEGGKGA